MKTVFVSFFLFAQVLLARTPGLYPNPRITPGVAAPVTQAEVLEAGYTQDARHVSNSMKWQVLMRYGLAKGQFDQAKLSALLKVYEIDHFISLELGGANDIRNLWPEPYVVRVRGENLGAKQKDVVETGLHRMMRNGLTLKQAQAIITRDWVRTYHQIKTHQPVTVPR
jgi:hypothetical protein